jgi:uncharacterized protein with von Willebrand factor type A (vWA) domain
MGEIKAASNKLATLPAIALLVDAPFSLCISRHHLPLQLQTAAALRRLC